MKFIGNYFRIFKRALFLGGVKENANSLKKLANDFRELDDAGDILSAEIITIMKKIHMPNGLNSVGFNNNDGPSLAKGTLPQHRVTKLSPREANENDLSPLFVESMKLW